MEEDIKILEDYIKLIKKGYCFDCNELCNIYTTPAFPSGVVALSIENLIKGYREKEADLYAANQTISDQLSIINDLEADLMSVYMKGIVDSNELWRQSIQKKLDIYKDSCNVVDTLIADVLRDLLEEKFNGATKNN